MSDQHAQIDDFVSTLDATVQATIDLAACFIEKAFDAKRLSAIADSLIDVTAKLHAATQVASKVQRHIPPDDDQMKDLEAILELVGRCSYEVPGCNSC